MKAKTTVFLAGHKGMVGSALLRVLEARSDVELIIRTRDQLDLSNQSMVEQFFSSTKICLLYTSPSPRDLSTSRMPSSA